jgi:glycine betaine catabolism A
LQREVPNPRRRAGAWGVTFLEMPPVARPPLTLPPLPVPHPMTRTDRVPAKRYYDPAFYAAEADHLWPRVWQMACFLAEIPNPGDFVTYEILDKSIIVVRIDDTTVRAFHNACRHRGVELVRGRGNARSGFTCPFHGWCYGLDGANTFIYQPDLFEKSNRCPEDLALPPCRVETWGPSAFVNLDEDAPPLRECLEPFASYHDAWKAELLRPEWWLSCRLPVNWKLAMEAFMEGYHVMETHPQLYFRGRSRNTYRDLSVSRLSPVEQGRQRVAATGGEFDPHEYVQNQILYMQTLSAGMAGMIHAKDVRIAEGLAGIELSSEFGDAVATWTRALNDAVIEWHGQRGMEMPDLNRLVAENMTSGVNFCFPHFYLLPMYSSASAYRIRPLGPEECLFELWSLTRYPEGEAPPAPPIPEPMAPEDPRWPPIPAQDFSNLPKQQRGLHAGGFEYMRLSDQIEGMISNYHRVVDGYLADLPYEQLVPAMQRVSGPIETEPRDLGF